MIIHARTHQIIREDLLTCIAGPAPNAAEIQVHHVREGLLELNHLDITIQTLDRQKKPATQEQAERIVKRLEHLLKCIDAVLAVTDEHSNPAVQDAVADLRTFLDISHKRKPTTEGEAP